ncbi:hypothetical protein Patl1_29610 [Pistacia atlantica]|uniref:Uncharacterized protein n=1 Tax=Pistacia atlantica TaxID=434234 RepID=A0ACC1AG85_9ROSI|nr:hypothetical protein Patl1_29610 [Pistacia atlantica]
MFVMHNIYLATSKCISLFNGCALLKNDSKLDLVFGAVEVEDFVVVVVVAEEKVEVNLTNNKGCPVSNEATGVVFNAIIAKSLVIRKRIVDSGYSNHMIGIKSMFKELDETRKMQVKLGNGTEIQVEGKGTVAIKTSHGKVKLLHNVQFVLDLGYNLLSVGQLMAGGY